VEALAREIAGADANAEICHCARRIAEAEIDLRRVRHARHQILTQALNDRYYEPHANSRMKVRLLSSLLQPDAPEIDIDALTAILTSSPQGDDKLAVILTQEATRLHALDRYESRARARRNLAVHSFDRQVVHESFCSR
jgi:hypothetical protein